MRSSCYLPQYAPAIASISSEGQGGGKAQLDAYICRLWRMPKFCRPANSNPAGGTSILAAQTHLFKDRSVAGYLVAIPSHRLHTNRLRVRAEVLPAIDAAGYVIPKIEVALEEFAHSPP